MRIIDNVLYADPDKFIYRKSNNQMLGEEYWLSVIFENGVPRLEKAEEFDEKYYLKPFQAILLKQLTEYDDSDELNKVVVNNVELILRKDTRLALRQSITPLRKVGKRTMIIWSGDNSIELSFKNIEALLDEIDAHAYEILQITNKKRQEILNETSIDVLLNYDIHKDYPNTLNLTY